MNEADKIDKTIEGLEFTLVESCWDADRAFDEELMIKAVTDAIDLLKDCRPRVMTLEELRQAKGVWVWMERRSSYRFQGKPYGTEAQFHVCVDDGGNHFFVGRASRPEDSYEIEWRCWTSCPSDAQREAKPWRST